MYIDFIFRLQLGDVIDAQDESMAAWFEAKIVKVVRNCSKTDCRETPQKSSETSDSAGPKCNGVEVEVDHNENVTDKENHSESRDRPNDVEITKERSLSDVSVADSDKDTAVEDVSDSFLKHRPKDDDGFLYSVMFET